MRTRFALPAAIKLALSIALLLCPSPSRACSEGFGSEPISRHLVDFGGGNRQYDRILKHFHPNTAQPWNAFGPKEGPYSKWSKPQLDSLLKLRGLDTLPSGTFSSRRFGDMYVAGCSNTNETLAEFAVNVDADPLARRGLRDLILMRIRMLNTWRCEDGDSVRVGLAAFQEFSARKDMGGYPGYLYAAALFYAKAHQDAAHFAEGLYHSPSPWVAEAARILAARAYMAAAQTRWDGWSNPAGAVDTTLLSRSAAEYAAYLEAYPQGRYRRSAQGMNRRFLYLKGDRKALTAALLKEIEDARLAWAGDSSTSARLTLALLDFQKRYRDTTTCPYACPLPMAKCVTPDLTDSMAAVRLAGLESAKDAYRQYPGLFDYYRTALQSRLNDRKAFLKEYGGIQPGSGLFQRARTALVADAFEKDGQWAKARALWEGLSRANPDSGAYFQSRLAMNYRWRQDMPGLLDSASAVRDTMVLGAAIHAYASDSCLQAWLALPHLKGFARRALVRRLLSRCLKEKRYGDFNALFASFAQADREYFQSVEPAVQLLAKDSLSPKGLNDLGWFIIDKAGREPIRWNTGRPGPYLMGDTDTYVEYEIPDPPDRKPPCCGEAPGPTPDSMGRAHDLFLLATRQFGPKDKSEEEPRAIYYLLQCYTRDVRFRSSRGQATLEQRWVWYRKLNRKYPKSPWTAKMGALQ
ncbi:MAG: hypothetical protein JF616_22020 [Fibrobacteres bacterium]|nr:hypothetical protein [Fibrobacterota bacterium]